MTTSYSNAIDEIFSLFRLHWNSETTAIVGYVPEIRWQGNLNPVIPDASLFWCRISTQGVTDEQGTFCTNVFSQGSKRFTAHGLIFVQLFAPKSNESIDLMRSLAEMTQNIFRHSTANVAIRNSTIKELEPEDGKVRFNVIAEYEFDKIF